jgi:hypothetical protein
MRDKLGGKVSGQASDSEKSFDGAYAAMIISFAFAGQIGGILCSKEIRWGDTNSNSPRIERYQLFESCAPTISRFNPHCMGFFALTGR